MKITNSEQSIAFKENEDLLKRMNKGLERKINAKEDEIKGIDALYDKKIEQAKITGEEDYMKSLDRNQKRVIAQTNEFEEKIQGYRDQLKKAQDTVAKEETVLKTDGKKRIDDIKSQVEQNIQDQYISSMENQREVQGSTQDSVKEITAKSKAEKLNLENNARYEINALSNDFNTKTADAERDYRSKLQQDLRLHAEDLARQKNDMKKLMTEDAEKNKRLSSEQNRVHNDQLTFQERHQQDMLIQRDKDFKVRYENMVKEHDSILKELSTRFEADVKKVAERTSADKKRIEDKSNDPFYRIDKLNPQMVEDPTTVTVSLPVPEFEKENVHLSTQGRSIKMTLSRKYNDSVTAEDGSVNKSTRSELYSKELTTKDLLNPREITQNYADGVLTFKIKKA